MMNYELGELDRRLANVVRIGTILQVDTAAAVVTVDLGGITTTWLPWLTMRASAAKTWWAPAPGEQVLVLSPSGELSQGVVLPALYQDAHGPPSTSADVMRQEFGDGGYIQHDKAAHKYELNVPGGEIILSVGGSSIKISGAGIVLSGPRIDFN